jgi:hypothetical protein
MRLGRAALRSQLADRTGNLLASTVAQVLGSGLYEIPLSELPWQAS